MSGRTVLAVLVRPHLWLTAVLLVRRFRPDHGVLPSREFLDFRASVYGVESVDDIPPSDVVGFLRWCRRFPGRIR